MNAITTSSVSLNIKSNQVMFKGKDNSIYLDAHLGGVMCWIDFYTGSMIKNRNGFSLGDQTSVDTWNSQCNISITGMITRSIIHRIRIRQKRRPRSLLLFGGVL